jgi:hypothetical protein
MAKKTYNKKARTLQPAVMKLNFRLDASSPDRRAYIDISQSLSQINRRFYRQGLNWAVANVRFTTLAAANATEGAQSYVSTLPHTWATANAWMKTFSLWKRQQDEALAESVSEETAARFRDFKIYMEEGDLFSDRLRPCQVGPGRYPSPGWQGLQTSPEVEPSENWEPSQVVIPNDAGVAGDTVEYFLHMVGGDTSTPASKGMIVGYSDSRSQPQSPDPVGQSVSLSFMNQMFDVGETLTEVTANAQFRNDELPYDQDNYPGGGSNFIELESQGYNNNQSTIGVNTWNTGPFTAPCGLLRVDLTGFAIGSIDPYPVDWHIITVTLVPGDHRGYLCETMEEF